MSSTIQCHDTQDSTDLDECCMRLPSLALMLVREYLFCGSWAAFSLGCQPRSSEFSPCVTRSVLGSPLLLAFHECRVTGGH